MEAGNTDIVTDVLREIEARFEDEVGDTVEIAESPVCIPVVGETSMGKSRMLAEMLRGDVPPELLPKSSRRPETFVPLEITYGEECNLSLIKRERTDDTIIDLVAEYEEFPDRQTMESSDRDFDGCRFRLSVRNPALLWPAIARAHIDRPARVYLLDTPGWNSGDTWEVKDVYVGNKAPGLLWVSRPDRLQSRATRQHLGEMLEQLDKVYPATEDSVFHIFSFVTNWEESERALLDETLSDLEVLARERTYFEDVRVHPPLCAEFDSISEERLADLQSQFWEQIESLRTMPDAFNLRPSREVIELIDSWEVFGDLQRLMASVERSQELLSSLYPEDELFPSISPRRFQIHQKRGRGEKKLRENLYGRVRINNAGQVRDLGKDLPALEATHPMAPFWNSVLLPAVRAPFESTAEFLQKVEGLFSEVPEELDDFNAWWHERVHSDFERCLAHQSAAEALFPPSVKRRIDEERDLPGIVSQMIGISCTDESVRATLQQVTSEQMSAAAVPAQ